MQRRAEVSIFKIAAQKFWNLLFVVVPFFLSCASLLVVFCFFLSWRIGRILHSCIQPISSSACRCWSIVVLLGLLFLYFASSQRKTDESGRM
jgi:hypothetical protein